MNSLGLFSRRFVNPAVIRRASSTIRQWPKSPYNLSTRRYVSEDIQKKDKEVGERADAEETGVIEKKSQETLLYFDHVLPYRSSIWDLRQWLAYIVVPDKRPEAIKEHVLQLANPKNKDGKDSIWGLEITDVVPVRRDGGAFVKFKVPYGFSIAEINTKIQKNTIESVKTGLVNRLAPSICYSVKGQPWIEDLRRYPNRIIKVKFEGPPLNEEELYSLFRRYGTIIDIVPDPAVATVIFRSNRAAICSKNCLTGMKINNTVLHVQYDKYNRKNVIVDAVVNHTRISIPLILALLTGLAVAVFDPIREFSIENKITNKYALDRKNPYLRWFYDITNSTLSSLNSYFGRSDFSQRKPLWSERLDVVNELKLWIEENANTFIIVRGPRGTGKYELVMQHALHDRPEKLYLDCDKLIKSRNDSDFISTAAHEVGYFPVFPWLNSVSNIMDLAVQGLTGQKSGFSESKDAQFRGILSAAAAAIRRISLRGYKETIGTGENAVTVKEEDFLQQHPEKKPVIVIDRFTSSQRTEKNSFVYKELADWAALLTTMNIAHVIFLTEDVGAVQTLSEALPDQVFKSISLSDASRGSAKEYVLHQLKEDTTAEDSDDDKDKPLSDSKIFSISKELDQCLDPIGGRMLDLQAFVRRVKSGETPTQALERMVSQTAEQITQMFLLKEQGIKNAQSWELIKLLSVKDHVLFKDIIHNPLFKSNPDVVLLDLEQQGLITMSRDRGILSSIQPAKPLYRAAFQNIVQDPKLSTILEISYLYKVIAFETSKISKFETEMQNFKNFATQRDFQGRLQYISGKIDASNKNILKAEDDIKRLAK